MPTFRKRGVPKGLPPAINEGPWYFVSLARAAAQKYADDNRVSVYIYRRGYIKLANGEPSWTYWLSPTDIPDPDCPPYDIVSPTPYDGTW